MGIGAHNGIKLENPEAMSPPLSHTVQDELLSDMEPPGFCTDRIACIADMAAASFIVGMEDIKPQNFL